MAEKGQLSPEKLKTLLMHPEIQGKISATALERGLITSQQQAECTDIARSTGQSLTSILVQRGHLSAVDRNKLLQGQLEDIGIAKLAIKLKLISERDLEVALKLKTYQKSTCEILYEGNLITLSRAEPCISKIQPRAETGSNPVPAGLDHGGADPRSSCRAGCRRPIPRENYFEKEMARH